MTRLRLGAYTASSLGFLILTIPHIVFGAASPIVPQLGSTCYCPGSAPDYGCILQVVQNVINAAVELGVILCVIWIVYAGFSLMISGGSPEARSQGKIRITNAVVGIAVILCSWIIVDFVLKAVYEPNSVFDGQVFGPWNDILAPTPGDECIKETKPTSLASGTIGIIFGSVGSSVSQYLGKVGALCPPSNPACSVQALMGQGLNQNQAQALSCIAMTESSGNANAINTTSRACGIFQITNETSRSNWQNPANHGQGCSVSTACTNASCNVQTGVIMFKKSGYQPWTCPGCNNKASACVAKYDPGH